MCLYSLSACYGASLLMYIDSGAPQPRRGCMENHGKSRKITENHGKSWKITENQRKSRKITENRGKSGKGFYMPITEIVE